MSQKHVNSEIIPSQLYSLPNDYNILSFREGCGGMPGNNQFVCGTRHETITQHGKKPYFNLTLRLPFPVGKDGLTIAVFVGQPFDAQNYYNLQLNLSNMKVNEHAYQTDKIPFNSCGTGSFVMSWVWLNGVAGVAFDVPQSFFESIAANRQEPYTNISSEGLYLTGLSLSNAETNESVSDFDSVLIACGKNSLPESNKITDHQTPIKFLSETMDEKIYDVALSFAGEDRSFAEQLAKVLTENDIKVFYDAYEKADLWGIDLYEHLTDIYKNRAQFCVMFLSEHYNRKLWTNHERKAAQARAFEENREYILPIRVDNTEVKGILPTVGYLYWQDETVTSIAQMIAAKLNKLNATNQKVEINSNQTAANHSVSFNVKHTRQEHLQNHLVEDSSLLKEYEDLLRVEEEPKRISRYKREIARLKNSISDYEKELHEL